VRIKISIEKNGHPCSNIEKRGFLCKNTDRQEYEQKNSKDVFHFEGFNERNIDMLKLTTSIETSSCYITEDYVVFRKNRIVEMYGRTSLLQSKFSLINSILYFTKTAATRRFNNKPVAGFQIDILNGIQLDFFSVFANYLLSARFPGFSTFDSIRSRFPAL